MTKPSPNFIGTTIQHGAPYINNLPQLPPIVLPAPSATIENSLHSLARAKLPAPLQPGKNAAIHASKTAIDRLRELFSKVR